MINLDLLSSIVRLIGNALKTHVTQPLDLMCKPLNLIIMTLWYPQMLTLLMRQEYHIP